VLVAATVPLYSCTWLFGELGLNIPVVELDTQLFFKETYETRDRLVERYGLTLERPEVISVAQQAIQEGPNLWEREPDRCCHIRKVEPLERALAPYDAWITGIRREQALTRADCKARRVVGALRRLEDPARCRLGREARPGVHPRERDSVQPAARRGLSVDRLHPMHAPRSLW